METIQLTQAERDELNHWLRGQSCSAAQVRRARLILLIDAGERFNVIRTKLGCDTDFVARWKSRFLADRVAGLFSRLLAALPARRVSVKRRAFLNGRYRKNQRCFDSLESTQTGQ